MSIFDKIFGIGDPDEGATTPEAAAFFAWNHGQADPRTDACPPGQCTASRYNTITGRHYSAEVHEQVEARRKQEADNRQAAADYDAFRAGYQERHHHPAQLTAPAKQLTEGTGVNGDEIIFTNGERMPVNVRRR